MKTCFNTVTCGADKPLEQTIDYVGACGYDGIEVEAGRIDDYLTRHSLEDLKRHLDRNNLAVAAIMAFPFFAFNLAEQNNHIQRVEHYARIASDLGSDTLLCFICDAPPSGTGIAHALEIAGRSAQRYGEASACFGVKCAIEPIGGSSFIPGPRQALAVAGASGSDSVGIMMDTFHYYKSAVPIEDIRAIPQSQLLIVHVNDCPDIPAADLNDGHRIHPGHGVIPLVQQFRILKSDIGYDGFLSIEIFNEKYWQEDHEKVIRDAKDALDRVLAQV